jgi:hypothetical protein
MSRAHVQQLGVWGEHWADLSGTAQAAAWRRLAAERGVDVDINYHMTRVLLDEVLYAAGGAERELGQLTDALADVRRFADEAMAHHPVRSPEEWPRYGWHVSTPSMREASYCFVNLLSWARSTLERTDRPYRPGRVERAGLLPALAPGQLHDSVETALRDLKAALRDSRFLANYALHAGAVPGGGSPRADILPDGRLLARIPDLIGDSISTWEEFSFTENRDMLTYAMEVMVGVETFVDAVLDAFAANRPARVGPVPAWPV